MKLNYKLPLLLLLLSIFSVEGSAQNLTTQYDSMLAVQFPAHEPGAVALIAKEGKIIYQKAVGKADLELDVPMKTDMVFRVGSITKQFTAVSILMLMEQGKLKLDDPITKFIPNYPNQGHNITLHDLLTHTSGIANSTTLKPWDAHVRKKDFAPKELVDYFKNEPMRSVPGAVWRYNNFGYHLLGHVIELISDQSYAEFVAAHIFRPIGMKNSYYASHEAIIANRATGYTRSPDGFKHPEYISLTQPYAAGALMSTVEDQLIWLNALLNERLIKKETLQLAWSNYELSNGQPINYGYGWFVNEVNGSPTFEHAGGIQGFQSNAIYLPEKEVFVVVFTNCDLTDPRPISTRMAAITIGKPYPRLDRLVQLSPETMAQWVGSYEYPDGSTRIVELIDNALYWSRPGRRKFKLLPSAGNRFLLENTFTQVEFEPANDTVLVHIKARIVRREAKKMN